MQSMPGKIDIRLLNKLLCVVFKFLSIVLIHCSALSLDNFQYEQFF